MKFDAIIVLGAGITQKGNLTKVAKSRMDKALELFRDGAAQKVIVTGKKEAGVMKKYAVRRGIDPKCVFVENMAMDTIGNAFFTRKRFLEPRSWWSLIIVTSLFHLRRAQLVFRKVLGKAYSLKFVPSPRVLSAESLRKKLEAENGLRLATQLLGTLVADGDVEAVENFLKRAHPLYRPASRRG